MSSQDRISHSRSTPNPYPPTPIVHKHTKSKKKRSDFKKDGFVSCNKCRPHSCDKIFILPLDPIIMASGYLVYLLSTIFLPFILYALLLHKFVMKKELWRMAKAVQNQVTLMFYYSKKLIVFLLFVFFGSYIYIWCQIQLLLLTEKMLKNCSVPFCFTFSSVCWVEYLFSPSSAPSGLFWGCLHVCENFRVVAVQLQKNLMHQTVKNEWLFAVKDILSI